MSFRKCVLVFLSMLFCATPALADDNQDHFELTFGFMAGQRDYTTSSFAYQEGDGSQSLTQPFEQTPFDNLTVMGLRWELRGVISYVRMTMAFDLPFSSFRAPDTTATYTVEGVESEVIVQSVRPYDLRFGLGGEYSFGTVAPYADLIGGLNWTDVDLTVGGQSVSYSSQTFNLSARAGLRVYLRDMFFIGVSGEAGILGNVTWSAGLTAGFATGS